MQTGSTIFPGERRSYVPLYPSHPFPPELRVAISVLPSGFETLALGCVLSFDTLQVLITATDRTRQNIHALRREQAARRRIRRKYNDFWEACPCFGVLDDNCNVLEKLICLTLVVYCCLAFDDLRSIQNVLRGSRAELSKKIASFKPALEPSVLPEVSRAATDCHIWMWVIAVDSWRVANTFASRQGPPLLPEGAALFAKLMQRYPHVKSLDLLDAIVGQFLWTVELRKSVKIFWERMVREYEGR